MGMQEWNAIQNAQPVAECDHVFNGGVCTECYCPQSDKYTGKALELFEIVILQLIYKEEFPCYLDNLIGTFDQPEVRKIAASYDGKDLETAMLGIGLVLYYSHDKAKVIEAAEAAASCKGQELAKIMRNYTDKAREKGDSNG